MFNPTSVRDMSRQPTGAMVEIRELETQRYEDAGYTGRLQSFSINRSNNHRWTTSNKNIKAQHPRIQKLHYTGNSSKSGPILSPLPLKANPNHHK